MLYNKDQQVLKDENSALSLAALSVIGDRDDQQDSLGWSLKYDEGLIVLCDGMGGHEGGKTASGLTVETFLSAYEDNFTQNSNVDVWIDTAKKTDTVISQLKNDRGGLLKAGTTVVSVYIKNKKLIWCSVGDSRAYLVRNEEMVQLTQDHNYNTVLIEKKHAGLLDETEFQKENRRGEALISFVGIGNLALIDYSQNPLELMKDDKIILMSDGLYKIVTDTEILRILNNFNNIGEAVQALEMKARRNAKNHAECRDNMTTALIKIK